MSLTINPVMDGLGARLSTITGLRVYDYPPDSVSVPAAIVGLPEEIVFDETYGRGSDRASVPVHVLVSKVSDRASRDAISAYMVSVKAAVDGSLGGVVSDARVASAKPNMITVGTIEYLAVTFTIEVYG